MANVARGRVNVVVLLLNGVSDTMVCVMAMIDGARAPKSLFTPWHGMVL